MSKEYEQWKDQFTAKMGDSLSANDLDNLDKIVRGLETENETLSDQNEKLEKQNTNLKNDNWDMYKRLSRETPSSKGGNEPESKNLSYDDLFKK